MNSNSAAPPPVVMTIGGFDPSSGAGITADLKTFAAESCYGVAAITALTVQNSQGTASLHALEPSFLRQTAQNLLTDGRVKAIKIGMLATRANAEVVAEILAANPAIPAVLDPVIRSTSGLALLEEAGVPFLRDNLLRLVRVVTPNLDEASALTGLKVENVEGMKAAAQKIFEFGTPAVIVTGGHLEKAIDIFYDGSGFETFAGDHVKPDNTHGTGCTYSSAIAANLALGRTLRESIVLAKAYVTEAIRKAYPVGPGRLPLNHLFRMHQNPRVSDHVPALPEPAH